MTEDRERVDPELRRYADDESVDWTDFDPASIAQKLRERSGEL